MVLLIIIGSAIYFGTKDGNYNIEDSAIIAAPAEVVFEKVNNLKTWNEWLEFKHVNSERKFSTAEKSTGEGATLSWEGKKQGSVTTTKVLPYTEIVQKITFEAPMGNRNAEVFWNFESLGDSTKVSVRTVGKHSLTDKVYFSVKKSDFPEKVHDLQRESLKRLSNTVITDMQKFAVNVDGVTQYGGGYYMYTTSVAKAEEVLDKSKSMIEMVQGFITRNHLNASGSPFILYNEIDSGNNTVIFSTGLPIREKVITPEGSPVVCGFMEPVSAVKVTLKGNYLNIPEAYKKGIAYLESEQLQIDRSRKYFEIFATDPSVEPNPANWVTELYIPIQSTEEEMVID